MRKKFITYCVKVLEGDVKNYFAELEKLQEREVNFSELRPEEWNPRCGGMMTFGDGFFQVMDSGNSSQE